MAGEDDIQEALRDVTHGLGKVEGQLGLMIGAISDMRKDHERRLRSLEKWRWMHAIPAAMFIPLLAKLGVPVGDHVASQ